MDLVVKLMSVLKPSTPILTWLPRSRSTFTSHPNDTVISTATSFDDITDALVVTMKNFQWKKVGKLVTYLQKTCHVIRKHDVISELNIVYIYSSRIHDTQ